MMICAGSLGISEKEREIDIPQRCGELYGQWGLD